MSSAFRNERPARLPERPHFSSGPCVKRPGWEASALDTSTLGRSHRGAHAKSHIAEVSERSRAMLGIPDDWHVGLVPGSDTGALELALWSLLGPRGVDVLCWESFGDGWRSDIVGQLKLPDVRVLDADYGSLPDLSQVDPARDIVFTWNGTTSGVRVPDAQWISPEREGLAICDATSAAFAMRLDWSRLDVVTWSWQKVLGGEAAHGMLALSPRAVERIESHTPPWPLPKLFRLAKKGKFNAAIFRGATINTPSMLCVEDALDGLRWAESLGGLDALIARSEANLAAVAQWVEGCDWIDFLARDTATRSSTSICLNWSAPSFTALSGDDQKALAKRFVSLLESEGAALDIGSYRDAPAGLRLWGGGTVETRDLEALFPWLDWAWAELRP